MKNNINYKKYILLSLIISIIFSVIFFIFSNITYKNYSYNYNLEVEKLLITKACKINAMSIICSKI